MPVGTDTNALVPRDRSQSTASSSTALVVESSSGTLHATLRFARRRRFRVEFTLDVVNAGDEQLLATIYARTRRGDEVPVEPIAVWIGARTEAYVTLALGELGAFTTQTLVVRLQGPNVHRRLEAAVPVFWAPLWGLAGALLASLVFLIAPHLIPQIQSLVVPTVVSAGVPVSLSYSAANASTITWELDDAAQHRIDGGSLHDQVGRVQMHLPNAPQAQQYTVSLRATGVLGSDLRTATLTVLPNATPQPEQTLRISSISVDDANPPDGGRVTVRYDVNATNGVVQLVDAQRVVWSSASLSRAGVTILALPFFGHDKELQAQVIATRGKQRVEAGVGIIVHAGNNSATTPPPQGSLNPTGVTTSATPVVVIASTSVRAGGMIDVAVATHVDELQLALVDASGRTISAQSVSGDIGIAHIKVPLGLRHEVAVIATYTLGKVQASVIRRIPIVP